MLSWIDNNISHYLKGYKLKNIYHISDYLTRDVFYSSQRTPLSEQDRSPIPPSIRINLRARDARVGRQAKSHTKNGQHPKEKPLSVLTCAHGINWLARTGVSRG